MEIQRDFYLDKLKEQNQNGLIKMITGIHGCGKSYLLNTLFYNHLRNSVVDENHIIKFAFDSNDDLNQIGEDIITLEKEKRKVNPNRFMSYIKQKMTDTGMYYLLLDEVQMMDCFESVLNSYLYKNNVDVYVTGSNAKFLSKDIITEFAGRGDEIHMYPLSFSEFMSVYKGDKYEGLTEYMLYGGIPIVVLADGITNKTSILKNLFDEIYIRDIELRHKMKKADDMEDILNILSSSIGSLTNPEKLSRTFHSLKKSDITQTTIRKYLDYLSDSYLIESSFRYDIKGKAYINTPLKYYFSDLGLRNSRINFRQFEQPHSMENVVYNELRRRGFSVDVGYISTRENNIRKQLEVDFVCNLGTKRYYIQSAYSMPGEEKRKQEIRPFLKIDDSFRKIVITGDFSPTYYNDDGILFMNIYDFLLKPENIDF